jgi:hypothetical protein
VPFDAFYAAADAIARLATGILVKEANDGAGTAAGAQALWDNFIANDLLFGLGGTAWIVAAIAAAVAFRQAGARTASWCCSACRRSSCSMRRRSAPSACSSSRPPCCCSRAGSAPGPGGGAGLVI